MRSWKRVLSLMLALALTVSCLPGMSLHTHAAELPETTEDTEISEITEPIPEAAEAVQISESTETVAGETKTLTVAEPEQTAPTQPEKTVVVESAVEEAPELLTGVQTVEIPFQMNPLYEGILEESDFAVPEAQAPQVSLLSDYLTEAEAATVVREYLMAREESFTVCIESKSDYDTVSHSVFAQAISHTGSAKEGDYLRWQYGGWSASISYSSSGDTYFYSMTFTVTYYTTPAQEAAVDVAVNALLSKLDLSGKSDYEKIKGIYDYICENITYDYDNLNNSSYKLKFTAYGALINKTAVCQGYAVLLYRLALELGVDCRLISGTGNGGAHGWNIVQMDDENYYNLDSTWDAGRTSYSYFLKCDANFGNHSRGEEYSSETFYAAYPMGTTDYVPKTDIEPDPLPTENPCGENLTWTLTETGTLIISGTGSMEDYSAGTAPWTEDCQQIQTVVAGAGVTSIGSYAFYGCGNLTQVTLSDSVTALGEHAFEGCANLTGIDLPAGLQTIGNEAFLNCGLTEVTIPDSVMQIAYASFANCTALGSVSLPENLESIGVFSFGECGSVASVEFPASLKTIGENAFYRCTGLKSIRFNGDVPTIENNNCFGGVAAVAYYPSENSTWTQDVLLDYGGTLNWDTQGTTEETTISQEAFEAALTAAKEAGESYTLTKELVLTSDLTAGYDCGLTIGEGGRITVPEGVTLRLRGTVDGGEILVENGGKLSIGDSDTLMVLSGSLTVEDGGIVDAKPGGIYLSINERSSINGVEKSLIFAKTELFFQDETPLMDYFNANSGYGSYELSLLDFFTQAEDEITIPENGTLSMWGFTIPEGKTMINHGTILVEGSEFYVNGTLDNQGQILVYDENQLVVKGTMTGNAVTDATQTMTQAALQALLDEAAADEAGMGFDQKVVLTSSLVIPENVTVDMVCGGITVSGGTTLTINGSVYADNYPKILVEDGGCLKINGSLSLGSSASITVEAGGSMYVDGICAVGGSRAVDGRPDLLGGQLITQDGALVRINGTLSAAEGAVLAIQPGTVTTALSNAGQVTGMDSMLTVTSAPGTSEELASFAADGAAYGRHEMALDTDITLTKNVSIPRNTVVAMTAKLTVPEGQSLTNAGTILLNNGSELLVQAGGTLTNRGTITENGGTLTTEEGKLINNVVDDLSNVASNAGNMTDDEIRSAVQDMDTQALAEAMKNDEDSLANIAALEEAAGGQAEVTVAEELDISADEVSIVGANLNTAASEEKITLVIGVADEKELSAAYDSETAVCFSMELTNVEELTVPVKITLPIPDGMDPDALVILHYHGAGEPEVLEPTISQDEDGVSYASIVLTEFSDFVMVQQRKPVRGDFNGDYVLTIDDAAELLWDTIFEHAFTADKADFNGDQKVDEADVVYLLWHILFPKLFPLN